MFVLTRKKIGRFVWKIRCGKIGVWDKQIMITYGFWVHSKIALICIHLWQKQIRICTNLKKKNVSIFHLCVLNDFVTFLSEPKQSIINQRFGNVFQKLNQMSKETPSIIHENFIKLWKQLIDPIFRFFCQKKKIGSRTYNYVSVLFETIKPNRLILKNLLQFCK